MNLTFIVCMIAVDLITFTEHYCFVVLFLKEREYLDLIENFKHKSLTITNPYQFGTGSLNYSLLTATAQHS